MDLSSKMKFKGYSYEFERDFVVLNTTMHNASTVFKEEVDFDKEANNIVEIIKSKMVALASISKEAVIDAIESKTEKKVKKVEPVRISFDFAEPDGEDCSVDLYVKCGNIFGGFSAHIRVANDGKIVKMVGLS